MNKIAVKNNTSTTHLLHTHTLPLPLHTYQVHVHSGIADEKLDALRPPPIRSSKQWRVPRRGTPICAHPGVGEEELDVAASSVAALRPQMALPLRVHRVEVEGLGSKQPCYRVDVNRFFLRWGEKGRRGEGEKGKGEEEGRRKDEEESNFMGYLSLSL